MTIKSEKVVEQFHDEEIDSDDDVEEAIINHHSSQPHEENNNNNGVVGGGDDHDDLDYDVEELHHILSSRTNNDDGIDDDPTLYVENEDSFYQNHCIYFPALAGWFIFAASLSSYNKEVFGTGHMSFPCPLLLTSIHFLVQWIFSYTMCELFPDRFGLERIKEPQMSWKEYFIICIPCGFVSSADIGLSNLSLSTISITFYVMIKSSAPVFVLMWAYLFGIEKITWPLIGVIACIMFGEFLTVVGEVEFVLKGFIYCMAATILGAARWTLIQLQLQKIQPPLKTTIVLMRLLSPWMFAFMILFSCIIEQPWIKMQSRIQSMHDVLELLALGGIGGSIAICMVMCEFYLMMKTNAIVLMIGGVLKEVLTIFVGVIFFHDILDKQNIIGGIIILIGVISYKLIFHTKKHKPASGEEEDEDSNEISDSITTISTTTGSEEETTSMLKTSSKNGKDGKNGGIIVSNGDDTNDAIEMS